MITFHGTLGCGCSRRDCARPGGRHKGRCRCGKPTGVCCGGCRGAEIAAFRAVGADACRYINKHAAIAKIIKKIFPRQVLIVREAPQEPDVIISVALRPYLEAFGCWRCSGGNGRGRGRRRGFLLAEFALKFAHAPQFSRKAFGAVGVKVSTEFMGCLLHGALTKWGW